MPAPGLFSHRDFRRLWVADTISEFGSAVTIFALPLVAITYLHAGPFQVGLLAMFQYLAFLLVGLPAGVWVDRRRSRHVLIVSDLGRALLLSSVPVAVAFDALTISQLYVVGFGTGMLKVFFTVAYQSYIPGLVAHEDILEANAKLEASRGTAEASGPAIGGFLIKSLSAPAAIAVDAVSFLLSALFLARIQAREAKPQRKPDRNLRREIAEGLRYVFTHSLMRLMATTTAMYNLFDAIITTMFLVLLAKELELSPGTIGLVFTLDGAAAVIGALIATRVAYALGQGPAIVVASVLVGCSGLLIPLADHGWLLWLAAGGKAIGSIAMLVSNITQLTFRQRLCPRPMLGRMNATIRFVTWGTVPVGAFLGGLLGQTLGVRTTLWIGAFGVLLTVLPLYFSPLRTTRDLPAAPDTAAHAV